MGLRVIALKRCELHLLRLELLLEVLQLLTLLCHFVLGCVQPLVHDATRVLNLRDRFLRFQALLLIDLPLLTL